LINWNQIKKIKHSKYRKINQQSWKKIFWKNSKKSKE